MSKSPKQSNVLEATSSKLLEKLDLIETYQSLIIDIKEHKLYLFMDIEKFEEHLVQLINKRLQIQ